MVQIFISGVGRTLALEVAENATCHDIHNDVSRSCNINGSSFYLVTAAGNRLRTPIISGSTVQVIGKIHGGIDFQHREGSKVRSGGHLSQAQVEKSTHFLAFNTSQAALERTERLRKLALESIDITKDPYILRNHLGTFECKLCLTIHETEGKNVLSSPFCL